MWDVHKYKNNIAAIDEKGQFFTYGDIASYCDKFAKKISQRCLVFHFCSNQLGSLIGYIHFLNQKIVPVMLDAALDKSLIERLITYYQPDYLYIPLKNIENFPQLEITYSDLDYALVKTPYHRAFSLYKDLALCLPTSGSTGSPKLVRQSYKNIQSNIDSIVEYLNISQADRTITTLPMHYSYGLSIIHSYLSVGASFILTEATVMQREFWQYLKTYHVTSLSGVPYHYEMLNRLGIERRDLPDLKILTQAGGKLSTDLQEKFTRWAADNNKKFIVMYGQTEATARMSYVPFDRGIEKKGSIGIPIPKGKFSIIDENGNRITEPHKTGELIYEGSNVTLGYASSGEDFSKGDTNKGKLYTGDTAYYDEDDYYYIVGRKKRFLKIFGNRINLDALESLLKKELNISSCACSGVDDKAYIFLQNANLSNKALKHAARITGLHHTAFRVKTLDKFPYSTSGKIIYTAFEKYYD